MTARILGFETRAEVGLRRPVSVSRNITPSRGGVAAHYGGPRQPAAEPGSGHTRCVATWRAWQKYHMDTHGWSDIAYSGGFCQHGYAFAGRGVGIRTAANGTDWGNQHFYAVTWIGGEGQRLTGAAVEAFEWWVVELRKAGAGKDVRPHRFFKSTGCPGSPLVQHCVRLDNRDIAASKPQPAPTPVKPQPQPTKEEPVYYIYTLDGLDWGTDLVWRWPFEDQGGVSGQERKTNWVALIERHGHKVRRTTLTRAEAELLIVAVL